MFGGRAVSGERQRLDVRRGCVLAGKCVKSFHSDANFHDVTSFDCFSCVEVPPAV